MSEISQNIEKYLKQLVDAIIEKMSTGYWDKMREILRKEPYLKKTFPHLLLNPEKLVIYIGKKHWAIEYIGATYQENFDVDNDELSIRLFDYSRTSEDFFEAILGFNFDGSSIRIPLPEGTNQDLYIPTNSADDILYENGWNYAAQSMMLSYNIAGIDLTEKEHYRLINCFFYGTNSHGLITRHIKWMEIFPYEVVPHDIGMSKSKISFFRDFKNQALRDVESEFPIPPDLQYDRLVRLNRFVELFSAAYLSELEITSFLAEPENQFILKMAFFAKEVHSELECHWAESKNKAIRPDFFITNPNGYSDIVEFKMPYLKNSTVVGTENRETFSAEINSYISQTRVYAKYFDDPRNREHVFNKYGIKVLYPKRWLVVGRRWMFDNDNWREIENEFRDFAIRTYDDLIDGVVSQLY
ncbi:Shedu anti-phage system protein SduA domain-containing protein [Paenibacillus durus]|uniref:Shedu protein SduA C-terminal domain-containing protein n=1 Tax=Paenibacillus durus ATCC 35681 TaxID=1333534 RepID=A0A0F7F6E6_PAEDU|nr:Shedu anti-phage system protein SduA domain-containing protein [Paenibacillus durus]AKG33312.1 hypothetical protein VK70_00705 [Paenibacillus durus ATCC 35681]